MKCVGFKYQLIFPLKNTKKFIFFAGWFEGIRILSYQLLAHKITIRFLFLLVEFEVWSLKTDPLETNSPKSILLFLIYEDLILDLISGELSSKHILTCNKVIEGCGKCLKLKGRFILLFFETFFLAKNQGN